MITLHRNTGDHKDNEWQGIKGAHRINDNGRERANLTFPRW
jgi:hypothetical protein